MSVPAFTPNVPGSFGSSEPLEPGVNFCANASKIGTVKIKTPLLPNPLEGAVYLAAQDANPFGSAGRRCTSSPKTPCRACSSSSPARSNLSETGQVVATFDNSPQAAVRRRRTALLRRRTRAAGDARALRRLHDERVVRAVDRGTLTSRATAASSTFEVTSGPHGAPCPGASLPFTPSLTAGTTSIQAGGFSPFTMTMGREDGEQHLQAIELHMPPGLSGMLSSVEAVPRSAGQRRHLRPGTA